MCIFTPSDSEARIFQEKLDQTIAADALGPWIA